MLRNCSKIAFCRLIFIGLVLCIGGCSNTQLLLSNKSNNSQKAEHNFKLHIKSSNIPFYEYKLSNILKGTLSNIKLDNHLIKITLHEETTEVAFSEKEILKNNLRIICELEIFDKNFNRILSKTFDSSATYSTSDIQPFSETLNKHELVTSLLDDIAKNIYILIYAIVQ